MWQLYSSPSQPGPKSPPPLQHGKSHLLSAKQPVQSTCDTWLRHVPPLWVCHGRSVPKDGPPRLLGAAAEAQLKQKYGDTVQGSPATVHRPQSLTSQHCERGSEAAHGSPSSRATQSSPRSLARTGEWLTGRYWWQSQFVIAEVADARIICPCTTLHSFALQGALAVTAGCIDHP